MRVAFSHQNKHKFRHNFADTLNPLCACSLETESTGHFFLCYQNFTKNCIAFMNELNNTDNSITSSQPSVSLKIMSTSRFWLQLSNSWKIVIELINP